MICPVVISQEENWFVAQDGNSGIASQGKTIPEALDNLKEALELFFEDVSPSECLNNPVMLTTLEVCV